MAASWDPRAAPIRRAASNNGDLPVDAMYEVLLRLPAKVLCRLRAVCRPWRCLLSDPRFAAAHAARHREPLIIAGCLDTAGRDSLVDILDLSGKIVKRVRGQESDIVVSMAFDLVCVKEIETGSFRLLNPATGAAHHLPDKLAEEHAARGFRLRDYGEPVHLFGQVASTGECKVLRMLPYRHSRNRNRGDLFEVCTVNSSSHARWRAKQAPPASFVWNEWTRVVVGPVAYFLSVAGYFAVMNRRVTEQDWIISFDLEAEVWRPNIKGPSSLVEDAIVSRHDRQITLANLNGSLVIVHGATPYMDLWFLVDSEKDLWVKQYSVEVERCGHLLPLHPLLALEDGRLVTLIRCMRLLQIYDPRTNSFTNLMELRHASVISMYTGSLLSLDGEN
ncbi:hypothetical protein ACP70R_048133 [Stipagrostis hirtigluma subsp. patula]